MSIDFFTYLVFFLNISDFFWFAFPGIVVVNCQFLRSDCLHHELSQDSCCQASQISLP